MNHQNIGNFSDKQSFFWHERCCFSPLHVSFVMTSCVYNLTKPYLAHVPGESRKWLLWNMLETISIYKSATQMKLPIIRALATVFSAGDLLRAERREGVGAAPKAESYSRGNGRIRKFNRTACVLPEIVMPVFPTFASFHTASHFYQTYWRYHHGAVDSSAEEHRVFLRMYYCMMYLFTRMCSIFLEAQW